MLGEDARPADRLLGLELPRLARGLLRGPAAGALARQLRVGVRHGRGQHDLLPARARAAVARWAAETPPGFLFTVKASRYLTHVRRLRDLGEPLERFLTPLAPLAAAGRQGPFLWQLPPDFRRDDDRLAALLARVPPGRHAVEFRHPSWFAEPVRELLRAHGAALVIGHDPRKVSTPIGLTADFTLIRFHFGARGRDGNYSESELREWGARVRELRAAADVFAYFNNDWQGFAPRNAQRLRALCAPG
jgi:uncharacterized protein YecE (DUF72 family)